MDGYIAVAFYDHSFKTALASKDDIEMRVVVKFCLRPKLSPAETLEQIQNAPADLAHDTELEINLICFSYNTCRIVRIEPPPLLETSSVP